MITDMQYLITQAKLSLREVKLKFNDTILAKTSTIIISDTVVVKRLKLPRRGACVHSVMYLYSPSAQAACLYSRVDG